MALQVQHLLVVLIGGLATGKHAHIHPVIQLACGFLALAIGVTLGGMQLQCHFVLAIRALLRRGGFHPVVVEADLLEQVGDQRLLVRPGFGADEVEQLRRGRIRRLLVGLGLQEFLQCAVQGFLAHLLAQAVEHQ